MSEIDIPLGFEKIRKLGGSVDPYGFMNQTLPTFDANIDDFMGGFNHGKKGTNGFFKLGKDSLHGRNDDDFFEDFTYLEKSNVNGFKEIGKNFGSGVKGKEWNHVPLGSLLGGFDLNISSESENGLSVSQVSGGNVGDIELDYNHPSVSSTSSLIGEPVVLLDGLMSQLNGMILNDLESNVSFVSQSYPKKLGNSIPLPSVFNGNDDKEYSAFYSNEPFSTNIEDTFKMKGVISVSDLENQFVSNEETKKENVENNNGSDWNNNNNYKNFKYQNLNKEVDRKYKKVVNGRQPKNYRRKDQYRKYFHIDHAIEVSLTESLLELYESQIPTKEEMDQRNILFGRIKALFQNGFEGQNPELHLYGSSANGLTMKGADIDLCFKVSLRNDEEVPDVIEKLSNILRDNNFIILLTLPWARCPIIKFKDPESNIKCDVCLNNDLALKNTKLIGDYMKIDFRAVQLGIALKYWAKRRKINDPYTGTLSSYAFTILLINFLQRCNPPILPCLQQMRDENTESDTDIIDGFDCYYYSEIENLKDFSGGNTESLGSLFIGLFHLYSEELDYRNDVISIKSGYYLTKREKNWTLNDGDYKTHHFLAIEDPFETTHNLARTSELEAVIGMRKEFGRAFRLAMNYKPLSFICKYYKL